MNKKGEFSKTTLIILTISIFLISITNVSAQFECNPAIETSQCGSSITITGHGAVELCQTCYPCGDLDGVCPEDFANGNTENDTDKRTMMVRVATGDRPSGLPMPESNPIIFTNGNAACASIGGTCVSTQSKATFTSPWVDENLAGCTLDTPLYRRALCNAPKTAGCQNCPDPDCIANITGVVYDSVTNNPVEAQVNIITVNNYRNDKLSSGSVFSLQSPRGYVNFICTALGYDPYELKGVYLQRGLNILDCRMNEATCSQQCTIPDINGQPICRASCDAQNGCDYNSTETKSLCEGVPAGAFVTLERVNSTHIKGVNCCEGGIEYIYRPQAITAQGNVPNLLTRDYRKELNGIPVTLRIITYTTD